jgi:hypothetical protein
MCLIYYSVLFFATVLEERLSRQKFFGSTGRLPKTTVLHFFSGALDGFLLPIAEQIALYSLNAVIARALRGPL